MLAVRHVTRPTESRRSFLARREAIAFYLFISPWIIGFLAFTLGPMLASLYFSFTSYDIVHLPQWVGARNYGILFSTPLFWQSIKVTLSYGIPALFLGLVLGMALAILLNQKLPGLGVWRTIYYLPSVISGVPVALLWLLIFQPQWGILNEALAFLHIPGPQWQYSAHWVIPMFIIMGLWGVGGSMLIYLGGLQGIPTHLYEAAEIDGAGAWRRLFNITLPMLSPVILFNLILGIITVFSYFTNAFVMTQGGPNYASYFYLYYLFDNAWTYLRMGLASAQAWLFFAFVFAITVVVLRTSLAWVYYGGSTSNE